MATVYRGWDRRLGVARAIKLLSPALAGSANLRARFVNEARTMAGLDHPHIVSVHDVGEERDLVYLVMDLLDGGSLAERVDTVGPLSDAQAVAVLLPIADALEVAHQAGVIHRDIKPANILLTRRGQPRLTDFGIARAPSAGEMTRTDAVMGTLSFMGPEQRQSARSADARSDVYAMGATALALVTGCAPGDLFAAEQDPALLEGAGPELRAIIHRSTRYHAGDRYPSAMALRDALVAVARAMGPPAPLSPAPVRAAASGEVDSGVGTFADFDAPVLSAVGTEDTGGAVGTWLGVLTVPEPGAGPESAVAPPPSAAVKSSSSPPSLPTLPPVLLEAEEPIAPEAPAHPKASGLIVPVRSGSSAGFQGAVAGLLVAILVMFVVGVTRSRSQAPELLPTLNTGPPPAAPHTETVLGEVGPEEAGPEEAGFVEAGFMEAGPVELTADEPPQEAVPLTVEAAETMQKAPIQEAPIRVEALPPRTETHAPPPAPSATRHRLTVASVPRGAQVWLDGRSLGPAPLEVMTTAGAHQLRMTHGEHNGTGVVRMEPGRPNTYVWYAEKGRWEAVTR